MMKDNLGSQEQLIEFINEIPGGMGIYNIYTDGTFEMVYLNDGYYNLIGCSRGDREKYVGFGAIYAVPEEYRAEIKKGIIESIKKDTTFQITIPRQGKNIDERWLQLSGKIVKRFEDKCVAYVTYNDVTEYVNINHKLSQANTEIQIAADKGGILYWIYDVKKKQTIITRGKGYGYDTVIDNVPEVFRGTGDIHPDEEALYFDAFKKMEQGVDFCECYVRVYNHILKEYQWQHVMFTKFSDEQYIGSSIDVTEQKRAEQQYDNEIALRKELLKDCILFYQVNLSKDIIEEKQVKYPEFGSNKVPFKVKDSHWSKENGLIPDREIVDELKKTFSAESLLEEWRKGNTNVTFPPYQMKLSIGIRMVETGASILKRPATGEIIAVSYTKDITPRVVNNMISKRLLDKQYEAINIVDIRTKKYALSEFVYNRDAIESEYSKPYSDGLDKFADRYVIDEENAYYRRKAELNTILAKLDKDGAYSFSFHIKSASEIKPLKKMSYFYLDRRHYSVLSVLEDVTEVTRREKEIVDKLHKALLKAEKATKAKTEFLARMSHDMRTPMNAIIGLSSLTLDDADNPAAVRENMTKMRQASDFMLGLVNDILDMAKVEDGAVVLNMEPYTYSDFLVNMKTMFKPQCEAKGISISFVEPVHMNPTGLTDKLRLNQIFFNIFSNAIKYTPSGGSIKCTVENIVKNGKMISGDYIIADTGIGMTQEFQKHMFDPFVRENDAATSELQGSGLGLSITKQLVELMGGKINIKSKKNHGTIVTVSLSFELVERAIVEEKNEANGYKKLDESLLYNKKVLLVEDHPLNSEIAKKILEKKDLKVTCAENGKEAVSKFMASDIGFFDAILMDIRMPEMSGLEAARIIRKMDRKDAATIPIIAMSANAYAEDIQKSIDAGMNDHIAKPVEPKILYETLMKFV